jgi:D-glycero-alpha-D-manno-heptose-7-phosphate kinase
VTPGVEVSIRTAGGPEPVTLSVETFGDRYSIVPGTPRVSLHPLIEAAIDELPPPGGRPVEISVRSAVPAGCGTGTSAAVSVALLGGLARLRSECLSPRDIAYAAHRLEVHDLGIESGIQDQLSAAFGGINYIEIDQYPESEVTAIPIWEELSPLLTLVFLGRAHDSSSVHGQVIERARTSGPGVFSRLRDAADAARDAVLGRDLGAFGRAMIDNTEAQRSLHPELVGIDASRLIEMARTQKAIGWKVNGAGGDGGSVTILSATREDKDALGDRVAISESCYRVLPIEISTMGLQVEGAL